MWECKLSSYLGKTLHFACPVNILRLQKISLVSSENKLAAQAAGQTLPDATPLVSKIPPFRKIAVTFEPIQLDWTGSTILNRFGVMAP